MGDISGGHFNPAAAWILWKFIVCFRFHQTSMGSMGSLRQQSRGPTSNKVDIASKDRDVRCFFLQKSKVFHQLSDFIWKVG